MSLVSSGLHYALLPIFHFSLKIDWWWVLTKNILMHFWVMNLSKSVKKKTLNLKLMISATNVCNQATVLAVTKFWTHLVMLDCWIARLRCRLCTADGCRGSPKTHSLQDETTNQLAFQSLPLYMQPPLVIQNWMQFEEGNDSHQCATSQASNLFLFHFT